MTKNDKNQIIHFLFFIFYFSFFYFEIILFAQTKLCVDRCVHEPTWWFYWKW